MLRKKQEGSRKRSSKSDELGCYFLLRKKQEGSRKRSSKSSNLMEFMDARHRDSKPEEACAVFHKWRKEIWQDIESWEKLPAREKR